jgi:DNA-binding MarR family transcriptional regulator
MAIETLIVNPGRLRILTALASRGQQEFVHLRGFTQMTDGNLATHARRLHSAGLVEIDKSFRDGKPVTTFSLTRHGREALESHVQRLMEAIRPSPNQPAIPVFTTAASEADDWID